MRRFLVPCFSGSMYARRLHRRWYRPASDNFFFCHGHSHGLHHIRRRIAAGRGGSIDFRPGRRSFPSRIENSEVYAINQIGKGALTGSAGELMQSALAMCRRTGGALDISIYPVVRAWGFTTGSYQVPGEDTIGELLDHVDYTKIQYNDETGVVSVPVT